MEVSALPRDEQASAGAHKIALFGTGADLRLVDVLPGVIDAEPAPAGASAALRRRYGYVGFSARTGELGSLKALRLLFEAALDRQPVAAWQRKDGRYIDPLRPQVEPEGLSSADEVRELQEQHFLAVQRALSEADEVLLVLGGAASARDRQTGDACATVPGSDVAVDLRDRFAPHYPDLDELDADFSVIWQRLRAVQPNVRITLALLPPSPSVTLSRAEQQQLACLRALVDEWVWRFADVSYLPLWDRALSQRSAAEAESWQRAEALLTSAPPEVDIAEPTDSDDTDAADDGAELSARAERRGRKRRRKPGAAPSTVCEDELLEAFSK